MALEECEGIIERGLTTFIEVGQALLRIRDEPLYKVTHQTFEQCCRERWGWSRRYANYQIRAAEVAQNLTPMGAILENERQARVLAAALLEENRTRCTTPLPDAEVKRIAASIGRYPAGVAPGLYIDPRSAPPSLDLSNSVALLQGRIKFTWLRRRGSMIQAGFENGREARWPTATDLRTFARSQDILLEATGVLIPSPPAKSIKKIWEPIAQLIRSLADQDATNIEPPAKDEFEQIIRATWIRAGRPQAFGREEFFDILCGCQTFKRDHAAEKPPRCCVWIGRVGEMGQLFCWLYQDALLSWLSTPVAKNTRYEWDYVRTALLLLDFKPRELNRSFDRKKVHVRVWQGPLDLLVHDDTVPESEL